MYKHSLFLIFILAVLLMAGCTDESYFGLKDEDISSLVRGKGQDGPEHVTIIVGDYGRSNSISKAGTGAVIDRGSWAQRGASLRVYAFLKDSACFRSPSACLIDASLDEPGNIEGRLAGFNEPEYSLFWPLSKDSQGVNLKYPEGKVPYDFFAYSTGGMEVNPSAIRREDGSISFPLKIDGAADLLYSKAELTESQKAMIPVLGLSAQEQADAPSECFSDWSARLGIVPVLSLRHALTRICFDLYPAEEGCNNVIIDKVEVMSKDSCIFTVASADTTRTLGADFSADSKDAILLLTEEDGSKLDNLKYHTDYHGDFSEDILSRPHVRLGGSFLLPPDESYKFVFYTKPKGSTDIVVSNFTISPARTGGFLAGSCYVVRVAVHRLSAVGFDVDVDPWDTDIQIDSQN